MQDEVPRRQAKTLVVPLALHGTRVGIMLPVYTLEIMLHIGL